MSATANITIHASQFPEQVRRDLLESLRSRKIAHKFHYDSIKQTQKWLALHERFSPSRTDKDCRAIYEQGFAAAAERIKSGKLHVVGLGCGGGQKDRRLIQALKRRTHEIFYTPCDVGSAMVLTARQTALSVLDESRIFPFVCDLQSAANLAGAFNPMRGARRIITFFGMIPNFEPSDILPKLTSLVGPKDILLFSANMAPGDDYTAGMKFILPQYDNVPTRDWLLTFLTDLAIEKKDGTLHVEIEDAQDNLKRVTVYFRFKRIRKLQIEDNSFTFSRGEAIRLFFSYRYTPERIKSVLSNYRLQIQQKWITASGEEGVFLCSV